MPGGRPRKYDSPAEMLKAIQAYFVTCVEEKKPPSICGLALFLGFVSRNSLLSYEGYDKEYFGIIKKAKTQIELHHEEALSGGGPPGGHIFWLKNFGWRDKQEQSVTVSGGLVLSVAERKLAEKLAKEFAKQYDDSNGDTSSKSDS